MFNNALQMHFLLFRKYEFFFPMNFFMLIQHYVRLLFCIIILSEKKNSSQSTFMIKLYPYHSPFQAFRYFIHITLWTNC